MIEIDKISLLVTTDTDISISALEAEVEKEGYTLNYHALPNNDVTLTDVLNDRIPNLFETAYGGIEDLCVQLHLARPDGSVYSNRRVPRSSTGPNLKKIAIGSREMLGIPIQATLRLFHQPREMETAILLFPRSRELNSYQQALKKNRIPVPLASLLAGRSLKKIFEEPFPEGPAWGFALWGEPEDVDNLSSFLRYQAQLKRADWMKVEKGPGQKAFLEKLKEEALASRQTLEGKTGRKVTFSHLNLAKLIREIS